MHCRRWRQLTLYPLGMVRRLLSFMLLMPTFFAIIRITRLVNHFAICRAQSYVDFDAETLLPRTQLLTRLKPTRSHYHAYFAVVPCLMGEKPKVCVTAALLFAAKAVILVRRVASTLRALIVHYLPARSL